MNNPTQEHSSDTLNQRHITRFTYKFTNFQGWRVAISRQGITLARYFSDKQYGHSEIARQQAVLFRDMVLNELKQHPERTREILDFHRVQPRKMYPAGLKPNLLQTEEDNAMNSSRKTSACSMRSNNVLHGVLRKVCRQLQLDTASVLKLSLYLFALQYSQATELTEDAPTNQALHAKANPGVREDTGVDAYLQRIITQLERQAEQAGLPSFEEFATGKMRPQSLQESDTKTAPRNCMNDIPPEPPPVYMPTQGCHMRSPRPSPPSHVSAPDMNTNAPTIPLSPPAEQQSLLPPEASPLEAFHHNSSRIVMGNTAVLPLPDTP